MKLILIFLKLLAGRKGHKSLDLFWKEFVVGHHIKVHYSLIVGFIATAIALVVPALARYYVDAILVGGNISNWFLILSAWFSFELMRYCGRYLSVIYARNYNEGLCVKVAPRVMDIIAKSEASFQHVYSRGDVLSRIQDALKSLHAVIGIVTEFHGLLIYFIFIPIAFFIIKFEFMVFGLLFAVSSMLLSCMISFKIKKYQYDISVVRSIIQPLLIQYLEQINEIKIYGLQCKYIRELHLYYERLRHYRFRKELLRHIGRFTRSIFSVLSMIVYNYLALVYISEKQMTIGDYFAYAMWLGYLFSPFEILSILVVPAQGLLANTERMNEMIEHAHNVKQKDIISADEAVRKFEHIECDGVGLTSYDGSVTILENINMSISSGDKIAIVGASGSGKSSLCYLLPRIYECSAGQIRINGIDARKIPLNKLRSCFSYVQQVPLLFKTSIYENIALSSDYDSTEKVMDVLRAVELEYIVKRSKDGIKTELGETGAKLSVGEKHRINLARAIYQNRDAMILDEVTAGLDSIVEKKLLNNLKVLMKDKTLIVVTHRLQSITDFDKIIVLSKGRMVEQGTHLELMKMKGKYFGMFEC